MPTKGRAGGAVDWEPQGHAGEDVGPEEPWSYGGGWAQTGRDASRTRHRASNGNGIAQERKRRQGHVEMCGTLGQFLLDGGLQTEILKWMGNHSFMVTKRNTPCVWLKTGSGWAWVSGDGGTIGGALQGEMPKTGPRGRGRGPLEVSDGGVRGPASREARKPNPHTPFTFQRSEEEA